MEVKVCLDQMAFQEKPEKDEIIKISNRIAGEQKLMPLEKLAILVGNYGHTFCPAIFTQPKRRSEFYAEMQLFPLDFDSGVHYEKIKKRAEQYGISISFAYETFSSTKEKPKFRLVFRHEIPIKDMRVAALIFAMLGEIFPERDSACKDLGRMFFGGKRLIGITENAKFDIEQLSIALSRKYMDDSPSNAARKIRRFADKNKIDYRKTSLLIKRVYHDGKSDENAPNSIYNKLVFGAFSSLFEIILHQDDIPKVKRHNNYRKGLLADGRGKCILFDEFVSGKELSHYEKFLLATNIIQIEGGKKLFMEALDKAPDTTEESKKKWKVEWDYIRNNAYKPMLCERCPYIERCKNHKKNLLLVLGDQSVEILNEKDYYDIEFVQNKLQRQLQEAIEQPGDTIHLIKAQTAIGKTFLYCQAICDADKPFLVAVPTVRLKQEVLKQLQNSRCKLPVIDFPSLDELGVPEEIKNLIKRNYKRGIQKATGIVLKQFLKEHEDTQSQQMQMQLRNVGNYLKAINIEELKGYSHVVMTHARLLSLPETVLRRYTVIIDEDILLSCLRGTDEITRDTVEKVCAMGVAHNPLKHMLNLKAGKCYKNEMLVDALENDVLDQNHIYENINGLLNCSTFYVGDGHFSFFTPKYFPRGKYIVLSATLSAELYRLYYKNHGMIVKEYPNYEVKYKGRVVQYTAYSCSRRCLEEKPEIFDRAREITGNIETLTFNRFLPDVFNETGLSITNCAGSNRLKGQNICVIGTPFTRPEIYKMIGLHLGADIETEMGRKIVEYGQYRFRFMAFEKGILQTLQLYMISSDLEQSIGRARILREDVTVYLFSNFPCEQAELIQEDYLGGCGNEEEADVPAMAHQLIG